MVLWYRLVRNQRSRVGSFMTSTQAASEHVGLFQSPIFAMIVPLMFVENVRGDQSRNTLVLLGIVLPGFPLSRKPRTINQALLSFMASITAVTAPAHTHPRDRTGTGAWWPHG